MQSDLFTTESAPAPPDFAEFWMQYPRKVGRQQALKRWLSIPPANHTPIMAALLKQNQIWAIDETPKAFIPHAATWLNQARWQDDLDQELKNHERTKPFNARAKRRDLRNAALNDEGICNRHEGF